MLHPSYTDLMNIANSEVEQGEQPVVNSRYSIVLAAAKRARLLIDGSVPLAENSSCPKPLSIAIDELASSAIKINGEEAAEDENAGAVLNQEEQEEMVGEEVVK